MKRILKSTDEPKVLTDFKNRFKAAPAELTWTRFKKTGQREQVKDQIRVDQRGLCAYCENRLISGDESVEHFVARDADHSRELDWTNLILCCAGGERPLPEEVADGTHRYDPAGPRTCGHAKNNSREAILDPLRNIPCSPRLFRLKTESGEIVADEELCRQAAIDPALATNTIRVLGLACNRLNTARRVVISTLVDLLGDEKDAVDLPMSRSRERRLAEEQIPVAGTLPSFFTTIRFILGEGAEAHLKAVSFEG